MLVAILALTGTIVGLLEHTWLASRTYTKDVDTPRLHTTPPAWITAGTLAGLFALTVATHDPVTGIPIAILSAAAVPLAWIDWDVHRLPNAILGPLTAGLLTAGLVLAATTGHWDNLARAAVGLLAGLATGLLLSLARVGLGAGDIKLLAPLALTGAWISWTGLLQVIIFAIVANGALLATLVFTGRLKPGRAAMGPGLLLGALLALLLA